MKKAILIISLFTSLFSNAQTDYSLGRVGDYIMGVYVFINTTPSNQYDFVDKIKTFDIYEADEKEIEKVLKKAKKKNPYFDGIIFRRGSKTAELIKFRDRKEVVSGFRIGESVTFMYLGKKSKGTILLLDDAKKKAVVEYLDEEGEKQNVKVPLKNLSHQ